jgi:hypothetical protein
MERNAMKQGTFLIVGLVLAAAAGGYWFGRTAAVQAAGANRVFEIRTYTANEGKLEALHSRFRDHTLRIFDKHDMKSISYWSPMDEPLSKNTLIYVLAFPNREAAKKSWDDFRNDPEWQKVSKESEANGRLVSKVESVFVEPADYSPMK